MFYSKANILFILLSVLVSTSYTVQAGMFDVAVKYDLRDEESNCTKYGDRLQRVSSLALYNADLLGDESDAHWEIYASLHNRMVKIENDLDSNPESIEKKYNHAGEGQRRQLCDSFCEFMCYTQGTYCWCCSCCYLYRRRNMRGLTSIVVPEYSDPAALAAYLDDLEARAEQEVYNLLNQWHHQVPCLAHPYTVSVEIVPSGSTEDYQTLKTARDEAKAANKATKDDNAATGNTADLNALTTTTLRHKSQQDAIQKLHEIREQLKAERRKLWVMRERVNIVEEAEVAAEKAVQEFGV